MGGIVPDSDLPTTSNVVPDSDLPNVAPADTGWLGAAKGVGDAALTLGAGGVRAIENSVNDLLPEYIGGQGSRAATAQDMAKNSIFNYQPQTEEGKYLMGQIRSLLSPVSAAASTAHDYLARTFNDRTADVVGDIATLAPAGIRDVRDIGGMASASRNAIEQGHPLTQAAEADAARLDAIKTRAEARGYDLPEGGTQATHAQAAINNRDLVNADVRSELGLPKNSRITPELLTSARAANASPAYQAIQQLPDKIPLNKDYVATAQDVRDLLPTRIAAKVPENGSITGQQAVDLTKMLRNRAAQLDKATGVTASGDTPADLAAAHRDLAEGIEDSVRDRLTATGRQQLADDWNNARIYTAKTYSVQSALDGAGNVKAGDLKTQLFKKQVQLSGNLEDLAHLSAAYPEAFRASRVTMPQVGPVKRAVAGALPLAGASVGGALGGGWGAAGGERGGAYLSNKLLGQ